MALDLPDRKIFTLRRAAVALWIRAISSYSLRFCILRVEA
jgi:hypothetical protein